MSIFDYIRDTRGEMRHVVWPNKRQALAYTIAIIAFTVVVAIILGAFDYLFAELVKRIVE